MQYKMYLTIILLVHLSACASMINSALKSSPSSKAAKVIETVYPKDVDGCQMLGEVMGSSRLGDVDGDQGSTSLNNALVETKENAAKLNATHILIVSLKKAADVTFDDAVTALVQDVQLQVGGSEINAKAYKC